MHFFTRFFHPAPDGESGAFPSPRIFGDKASFAIQYLPFDTEPYAFCHLCIGGALIGDPEEICYLPTWVVMLRSMRQKIDDQRAGNFLAAFQSLTDREIFELILKSNQLEDEFGPAYDYLPQLSSDVWFQHIFLLDETIDRYIICYYIKDNQLTFLWEDRWANPDPLPAQNQLCTHTVPLALFLQAVDDVLHFLTMTYPKLRA